VLGKNWKIVVGGGLVLLALLAFAQNIFRTEAQEAFINASLTPVLTPIPGRVDIALPAAGERVARDVTAVVENIQIDRGTLIDLEERLATVVAEIEGVEAQLQELQNSKGEFQQWAESWRVARARYLEQRLAESRSLVTSREQSFTDAQDNRDRLHGMQANVSVRMLRVAQTEVDIAEQELAASRARLRQLQVEREALNQRIQIADSFSERAYSDQKIQETALLISLANARMTELRSRRTALEQAVANQSAQFSRDQLVSVPVPEGMVWRRTPRHSFVPEGGSLGEVALCDDLLLTATLGRREFRRLRVGMTARTRVSLPGGETVRMDGRVIAVTGPSVENSMSMAIPFGRASSDDGYGVVVRLNDPQALDCQVGASARVSFRDG
jgi:uncharacterized small protein (DUF1192 family)